MGSDASKGRDRASAPKKNEEKKGREEPGPQTAARSVRTGYTGDSRVTGSASPGPDTSQRGPEEDPQREDRAGKPVGQKRSERSWSGSSARECQAAACRIDAAACRIDAAACRIEHVPRRKPSERRARPDPQPPCAHPWSVTPGARAEDSADSYWSVEKTPDCVLTAHTCAL